MQNRYLVATAFALLASAPMLKADDVPTNSSDSVSLSLLSAIPLFHANLLIEHFLNERLGLGLNLSYANSPFSTYESRSISFQGRQFFMSSFYTAAGLSYVNQYKRFDELLTPDPQWYLKDRALCLRLAIGNQKSHPSGFFFGAEWAEAGIPLMRIGKPILTAKREVDQETKSKQERKAKNQNPPFEFGAARLFLGYRF